MKRTKILLSITIAFALIQSSYATDIQTTIENVFGKQALLINDYDSHLKEVVVESQVYFTTHDGRYLFAGPVFDTERGKDIVKLAENQLRRDYLSLLEEDVFISYPSSSEKKYQITVFTDIDCPYCRKLHSYMPSFNRQGISVNYIMLPRSGIDSESYKKTLAAVCSTEPAESITRAMQNHNPKANNCDSTLVKQHLKIAQELKINSTPTVVLANGEIKLGLVNPDQLIVLLNGSDS